MTRTGAEKAQRDADQLLHAARAEIKVIASRSTRPSPTVTERAGSLGVSVYELSLRGFRCCLIHRTSCTCYHVKPIRLPIRASATPAGAACHAQLQCAIDSLYAPCWARQAQAVVTASASACAPDRLRKHARKFALIALRAVA